MEKTLTRRTLATELVLPTNSISLDKNEMEYVNGGWYTVTEWWGVGVHLNGAETNLFLSNYNWAVVVIAGASGFLSGVAAAAAAVLLGAYGGYIQYCNNNNSGVTFLWSYAQLIPLNPTPVIIDNY